MTTPTAALLDGARVRARRHELGLSERKVASLMGAGFSVTMLRSLEAGTNNDDLTLGLVRRLADVLAVPVNELLAGLTAASAAGALEPDVRTSGADQHGPVTLEEHLDRAARRIGAVLTGVDKAMPEQVLAELGETTLDDLPAVLAELDARLATAGAHLHRVLGLVGIRPATDQAAGVDDSLIREAWRRHLGRVSLNVGQVNVLARAVRGESTKPAGNVQVVKAAELVNAGLLERTESGGHRPTAAVEFSLNPVLP